MLFRVEGSPQTGSTSVIPLQTQKVGSHLGVLLSRGGQGLRESTHCKSGVNQRISLQLHVHPILLYLVQFINMQDSESSLSLLPREGLKLGLIFTFYFRFFAQTENCFYKLSLLPETL